MSFGSWAQTKEEKTQESPSRTKLVTSAHGLAVPYGMQKPGAFVGLSGFGFATADVFLFAAGMSRRGCPKTRAERGAQIHPFSARPKGVGVEVLLGRKLNNSFLGSDARRNPSPSSS